MNVFIPLLPITNLMTFNDGVIHVSLKNGVSRIYETFALLLTSNIMFVIHTLFLTSFTNINSFRIYTIFINIKVVVYPVGPYLRVHP